MSLTYANDPAVAMVEITNEDSLFMWSAPRMLPNLPEPYRGCLEGLWCDWLGRKYKSDEALREAWQNGAQPLGDEMIRDGAFQTLQAAKADEREWLLEQHEGAAMTAKVNGGTVTIDISKVSGTNWHLQFKQAKLDKLRRIQKRVNKQIGDLLPEIETLKRIVRQRAPSRDYATGTAPKNVPDI